MKELTERRKRKRRKGPKGTLGSLQRWLKGATPAVRAYSKTMSKAVGHHKFGTDEAEAAAVETANLLRNMETEITRLRDSVDAALAGF